MLLVENLSFARGDQKISANLAIERGTICGIIGPSGAGKTSLVLAIAGLIPTDDGAIFWEGAEIGQLPPTSRPISLMFQDHNLFTHLSLRDNLKIVGVDDVGIENIIALMGLKGHEHKRPQMLSGGQKARGAFARNILHNKPIQIFDEPFAAVGPSQRRELQEALSVQITKTNGIALVIAHNINDLDGWADQIIWVGRRVEGPFETKSFLRNPSDEAAQYL